MTSAIVEKLSAAHKLRKWGSQSSHFLAQAILRTDRFLIPTTIIILVVTQPLLVFSKVSLTSSNVQTRLSTSPGIRSSDVRPNLNSDLEAEWLLRMSHKSSKDTFNQKNLTSVTTGLQISYWPIENYAFIFTPVFRFRNGFQQTLAQTKSTESQLGLRETSFNYLPFMNPKNSWMLSAGILPIDNDSHEILINEQSFPGARAAARWEPFYSSVSHTIPTSQSLSTETNEFEQTPGFSQFNLGFNFDQPSTLINGRIGYYQFSSLPQSLATQSGPKGNSVQSLSGREYQFIYQYQGPFLAFDAEQFLNKNNSLGFASAAVQNTAKNVEEKMGWTAKTFYKYRWKSKTHLQVFYQQFYIESDATVAQFNEEFIGGTNRNGFLTGLSLNIRDKFSIQLSGGTSDAITESPTIFRENFFRIRLETQYAGI